MHIYIDIYTHTYDCVTRNVRSRYCKYKVRARTTHTYIYMFVRTTRGQGEGKVMVRARWVQDEGNVKSM